MPQLASGAPKGARSRQTVKQDYVSALGIATWSFASCEWQVVWCCELIKPGSLQRIVGGELTAGKIAKHFSDLTRNMPKSPEREELKEMAQEFSRLVQVRNGILHGKPCTGPNGDSRLSNNGVLEIPDLEDAADAFAHCGSNLNRLYYGYLINYAPP